MTTPLLHIDSSARQSDSLSRQVANYLVQSLNSQQTVYRDLNQSQLRFITEADIGAYYTPQEQLTDQQKKLLALSDELVAELQQARQLILSAPMYNFSVPAILKAWIDMVCRVGHTFRYTENGPQGLSHIERAFVVVSTGGTPLGSPMDHSTGYLKQVLNFIGVTNIHFIDVAGSNREPEKLLANARAQVDSLLATAAP